MSAISPTQPVRVRRRRVARPSRRRLWWWLVGGGLVVAACVAVGVDLWVRYLPAARALRDGRDAAVRAEAIIGRDLDHLDHARIVEAQALLETAQDDLGPRSAVVDDGWLASIAGHLPILGTQVDAARALRRTGLAGTRLGSDLLPLADAVVVPQGGAAAGMTLPRATVAAEDHAADLVRISADLEALDAAAATIPRGVRLYGPLASARTLALADVQRIDSGVRPAVGLLQLLPAAVGRGDHRYLLLLDNPAEQRPGGGFIGAVGEVTFSQGQVIAESFRSSDFANQKVNSIAPPRPLAQYLFGTHPWEMSDANWSPDFAVSAREVAHFYALATGTTVDGVIGVDPVALGYTLRVLGSVQVAGFTQTVSADDTLRTLNEIINGARPGDPGKAYIAPFATAMLDRLLRMPLAEAPAVATALLQGADEKHIVLQFTDPELQQRAESAGYAGRVPSPESDSLEIVDANLSGGKEDLVVQRGYRLDARVGADGETTDHLTLTYRLPVVTDPAIARLDAAYAGEYRDYLRVYIPETASLESLTETVNGRTTPVAPEEVVFELHREAVAYMLVVRPGEQVVLTLTYSGPFADPTAQPLGYTLAWTKQIGAPSWPTSLSVTLPTGARRFSGDTSRDVIWTAR